MTVTFQVLNGSEPVLGYSVIQGIDQASYTLAQAVGYQVLKCFIVVANTASSLLMASFVQSFSYLDIYLFIY